MVRLEHCLQTLCGCVLAILGATRGTCDTVYDPLLNVTLNHTDQACPVQLYYALVILWKPAVLKRITNAGSQEGLDAWKLFVLHHKPKSLTRSGGLSQELLNFSFGRITEMSTEKRERFKSDLPTTFAVS